MGVPPSSRPWYGHGAAVDRLGMNMSFAMPAAIRGTTGIFGDGKPNDSPRKFDSIDIAAGRRMPIPLAESLAVSYCCFGPEIPCAVRQMPQDGKAVNDRPSPLEGV